MPKISALPPMTNADGDDEAPIVDDSASSTKKFTLTLLKTWLQSLVRWIAYSNIDISTFPVFAVRMSAGQNITNTTSTIQFDTELVDTKNGFNTTNYTYTVPAGEGGLWEIFVFLADGDSDSTRRIVTLLVNGVTVYRGSQYITTFGEGYLMQPVILAEGDTIVARGQANPAATVALTGGADGCKFWGKRIAQNKIMEAELPRKQKWNKTEWANARQRAIASKDAVCAICHKAIDLDAPAFSPLAVEVDHIVPRSRGGQLYALDNLQLTHSQCNRKKGAKMAEDYEGADYQNPVPLSNAW